MGEGCLINRHDIERYLQDRVTRVERQLLERSSPRVELLGNSNMLVSSEYKVFIEVLASILVI